MKIRTIIRLLPVAALLLFVAPSCVKEGPPGLDGVDGQNGVDGQDGQDGADGVAFCISCHNSTSMSTIKAEFAEAKHSNGTSWAYAGGRADCARCHSNEGFMAMLAGSTATSTNSLTCAACHSHGDVPVFQDGEGNPVFIRSTDPVTLIADASTTVDLGGSANICVNCHQPRTAVPDAVNDSISVTSSRYGPHHGPQGTMLVGLGMYPFTGSKSIPALKSHKHAEATCTACHMSEASHTFEPEFAACATCHGTVTSFDIDGVQTDVEELMSQIAVKLKAEGALSSTGSIVVGKYKANVARALWNYSYVNEDKSEGVHNPDYVIAILTNTLEAL